MLHGMRSASLCARRWNYTPWTLSELLPGAANTGAGRSHQRDRNSDEYLRTNDRAKLFANLSAAAVRPQLEQLYATDLKCLGY